MIEGNYLSGVTSVTFGGLEAADYLDTDGFLLVSTPPEGAGTVPVVVTTPGGSSSPVTADMFSFVAPPPPVISTATAPVTSPGTATSTHGYWLVGSDGGIFTFGSAQFYGSTGSLHAPAPRGRASCPRLTAAATGSTPPTAGSSPSATPSSTARSRASGSIPAGSGLPNSLNAPIVGMVPSTDGNGYFMVASDGGVFAFGDAHFAGSCPGIGGCSGAAVAVMPDASGQRLLARDRDRQRLHLR